MRHRAVRTDLIPSFLPPRRFEARHWRRSSSSGEEQRPRPITTPNRIVRIREPAEPNRVRCCSLAHLQATEPRAFEPPAHVHLALTNGHLDLAAATELTVPHLASHRYQAIAITATTSTDTITKFTSAVYPSGLGWKRVRGPDAGEDSASMPPSGIAARGKPRPTLFEHTAHGPLPQGCASPRWARPCFAT